MRSLPGGTWIGLLCAAVVVAVAPLANNLWLSSVCLGVCLVSAWVCWVMSR